MKLLHLARESNAPRQVFDRDTPDTDAAESEPQAEITRLKARIATLEAEVADLEAALAAAED